MTLRLILVMLMSNLVMHAQEKIETSRNSEFITVPVSGVQQEIQMRFTQPDGSVIDEATYTVTRGKAVKPQSRLKRCAIGSLRFVGSCVATIARVAVPVMIGAMVGIVVGLVVGVAIPLAVVSRVAVPIASL
jgi:hypothetical protein